MSEQPSLETINNNTIEIKGIKKATYKIDGICLCCGKYFTNLDIHHRTIYGHNEEYDEQYVICPECKKEIKIMF